MKKLMTSTIILLPLIILAIMLVSGAIMSLITHIYVESVEFVEKEDLVLVMKDENAPPSSTVAVNVLPLKAENREVIFSADDENIITVDQNGTVTAKFFGETYVSVASAENAAATAKRKVIVTDNTVHAIEIKEFEGEMYRGDTQKLLAEAFPYEALNKDIVWTTSDENVLSVSPSGDVVCKGAGEVTITASSAAKPDVKATAVIRCHEPLLDLDADQTPVVTALTSAQFPELHPTPANATFTVVYTSSDHSVASVDQSGAITFHKEGKTVITATAVDGKGNTDSVSVTYDCTDGYFTGPLFAQTSYTFDYDEHVGQDLGIEISKSPESSYRLITSVDFSRDGLIEYDDNSERFILRNVDDTVPLGTVTITVHARKYSTQTHALQEYDSDICTVTLTRNTKSLSFVKSDGTAITEMNITSSSVSFTEGAAASGIGVVASPANHTDTINYFLGERTNATLKERVLTFSEDGTAEVTVTAGSVSATLTVNYTHQDEADKTIEINDTPEQYVVLNYQSETNFSNGILQFTTPEGCTAECKSYDDKVVKVEGSKLVPQKGGFATVTVTFTAEDGARAAGDTYTIHVYVDRPVEAHSITFDRAEGFTTSLEKIGYTVTLSVPADAMEGKELFFGDTQTTWKEENGTLVARGTADFGDQNSLNLIAAVRYTSEAEPFGKTDELCRHTCTVHTTHGNLSEEHAPTVTYHEEAFSATGNTLHFTNLGEELTLHIDATTPDPADFVLEEGKIKFGAGVESGEFGVQITMGEGNTATVTLTALNGTYTGPLTTTLTVAGHEFKIDVTIDVLADTIEVKYDTEQLTANTSYSTMLSALDNFLVELSRKDEKTLTEAGKKFTYTVGETENSPAGNSFSVTPQAGTNKITVKSGTAEFVFTIEKVALADLDLRFRIEYSDNGHLTTVGGEFGMKDSLVECNLPSGLQGTFDICVLLPEGNWLGGMAENAGDEFSVSPLTSSFNAATQKITVSLGDERYFVNKELTLTFNGQSVKLVLNRIEVVNVAMTGFNGNNPDDVYKGYQQVRVFAKKSDYGDGNLVDYYRVPFNALKDLAENVPADPDSVVITLSGHNDKTKKVTELTQQLGTTVKYNGKTYTITKNDGTYSTLSEEGGTTIAEGGKYVAEPHVPWVDLFAADGKADIYFGNFGGLSETDIQNDYFGNFGGKQNWNSPLDAAYGIAGAKVEPSENAFSYLRLEAGDGAQDSKVNAFFNFNVLEDTTLVNVFNATGYYNNQKVVLHENLFGNGELDDNEDKKAEAEQNDQIMNKVFVQANGSSPKEYAKDTVYGNGYQVNLNSLNKMIVGTGSSATGGMMNHGGQENTGNATHFTSLYNMTMKGRNDATQVNSAQFAILFNIKNVYYTDLQNYSKMNPKGGSMTIKNSVLRNVAVQAVQLWNEASNPAATRGYWSVYFENVAIVNATKGISIEGSSDKATSKYHTVYIKGFLDALNYNNIEGLMDQIGKNLGGADAMIEQITKVLGGSQYCGQTKIGNYVEWFGSKERTVTMNSSTKVYDGYKGIYVNPVIVDTGVDGETKRADAAPIGGLAGAIKGWDGSAYVNALENDTDAKLARPLYGSDLVSQMFGNGLITAYTYNAQNSTDGGFVDAPSAGNYHSRIKLVLSRPELGKLFSNERDIRLLCQYLDVDGEGDPIRNDAHILWHTQKVYRDMTLVNKGYDPEHPDSGREENHIEALKQSLIDAKANSLWDGEWPDGTTLEAALSAASPALAMTALLSQTDPRKRTVTA